MSITSGTDIPFSASRRSALSGHLQQAILFVLSQAAAENRPFTLFTLATLQEFQARAGRKTQPAPYSIQRGLESLRKKGLVWRSSRRVYALENSGMGEWLLSDDSGKSEDG